MSNLDVFSHVFIAFMILNGDKLTMEIFPYRKLDISTRVSSTILTPHALFNKTVEINKPFLSNSFAHSWN